MRSASNCAGRRDSQSTLRSLNSITITESIIDLFSMTVPHLQLVYRTMDTYWPELSKTS